MTPGLPTDEPRKQSTVQIQQPVSTESLSEDSFEVRTVSCFKKKGFSPRLLALRESARRPSKSLNAYDDELLIEAVKRHQRNLKLIKVENSIFRKLAEQVCVGFQGFQEDVGSVSQSVSMPKPSFALTAKSATREEIVLNINEKNDIVCRDKEKIQADMDAEKKKFDKVREILEAKLEALECRQVELEKISEHVEQLKLANGHISFTKFTHFMDERLKKSQIEEGKIRLRYSSMRVQLQKITTIFNHKKLIGENLHEIDFEQLQIENIHLVDNIEKKSILLLELKRMTGAGNLKLCQQKKLLLQKILQKEVFWRAIKKMEEEVEKNDIELQKMNSGLDKLKEEYNKVKHLTAKFKAPEVIEYVMMKKEVDDLKKALKVINQRKRLKEVTLNLLAGHMKEKLFTKKVDPCWFE